MYTEVLGDSGSPHHLHGPSGGTGSRKLVWLDRLAVYGKGALLTSSSLCQSWELLGTPGGPRQVRSKEGC